MSNLFNIKKEYKIYLTQEHNFLLQILDNYILMQRKMYTWQICLNYNVEKVLLRMGIETLLD